jgi:hypothetical protein
MKGRATVPETTDTRRKQPDQQEGRAGSTLRSRGENGRRPIVNENNGFNAETTKYDGAGAATAVRPCSQEQQINAKNKRGAGGMPPPRPGAAKKSQPMPEVEVGSIS